MTPQLAKPNSLACLSQATRELAAIMRQIEAADGVLDDVTLPAFTASELMIVEAVDARISLIDSLRGAAEALESRIRRMKDGLASLEGALDRVLEQTKQALEDADLNKVSGSIGTLYVQANASCPLAWHAQTTVRTGVVDPHEAALFPPEFVKTEIITVLDVKGLSEAVRAGRVSCPGVERLERGSHVRIR